MKKIILLTIAICTSLLGHSQTVLETGDIAFMGSNTDGATNNEDNFAFVLLKDIDAATTIIFTDRGWNDDSNSFLDYAGDGQFTWSSGVARFAGDIITLDLSNLNPVSAAYSYIGDQIFAIQGSIESPIFIAGLQFNDITTGGDDLNWDGSAINNATSALPDALTTGDTAIRIINSIGLEEDNWQFSCALAGLNPIIGSPAEIRTILHDRSNWVSNNTTIYNPAIESGCSVVISLSVAPEIVCPSVVTVNTQTGTCSGVATFEATDTVGIPESIITYSHNPGSVFSLGTTTVTATATNAAGTSTCTFEVVVEDNLAPTAVCNSLTVQLNASGTYVLNQADFNAISSGSSDACGIASITTVPNIFTCDDIGAKNVTLTVTDVNGISSTCIAVVTVEGILPLVSITEDPLPEFCQGAEVVLTANTTQPQSDIRSYAWIGTGVTGPINEQSVRVTGNGTYTVVVTSETNCSTTETYTVSGFDAGELISSYTILASEEVFLQGSNLVQSGAVGVTTPGTGRIRLFQASNVVGFAQASNIQLMQGSTVGEAFYQPATPTIPTFMVNNQSTSSSADATVNVNQTQTLSGSLYNVVDIKQGATVTFSASNLYINNLITSQNATIEFAGCANVFINQKFTLAKNGTINANGNKVVFYVNDDIQIEKGSYVRARMHSNGDEILAEGELAKGKNSPQPTYMTGLFIAKNVQGSLNVIWKDDTLCEPCALPRAPSPTKNKPSYPDLFNFEVISWPNPSHNVFNLKLKTEDYSSKAQIKVFDMSNKLVHVSEFDPTEVYKFGNELQSGVYIVKVVQAKNTASVRVVKY